MDYSENANVSRDTWAPRSPVNNNTAADPYPERPPVPPQDVDMREARDRDDRGERREDRDGDDRGRRQDDRPPPDRPGFRGGYERRDHPSGPPSRPPTAPSAEPNSVLGVFGLSIRTRERDLEDEFSRYGEVEKVIIVYDQRTDRSRGFGFITMRSVEDASRCIEKLNGMMLHGRAIRVDFSATKKAHAPTPGEYRGEKRPFDDRPPPGGGRYDDRRGGGYDRWERRDYDDRRPRFDRDREPYGGRDRDGPYGGPPPRRDFDDPYGGRSRRDDDRPRDFDRRRSPSPQRRRYSASPSRRPPPPPPPAQGDDGRF